MTNAPETYSVKSHNGVAVHGCRASKAAAVKLARFHGDAYVIDTRSGTVVFDTRPLPSAEYPINKHGPQHIGTVEVR